MDGRLTFRGQRRSQDSSLRWRRQDDRLPQPQTKMLRSFIVGHSHTRVARNARGFALLTVMPSNLNSTVLHHNSDNEINVTKNDMLALLRKDQACPKAGIPYVRSKICYKNRKPNHSPTPCLLYCQKRVGIPRSYSVPNGTAPSSYIGFSHHYEHQFMKRTSEDSNTAVEMFCIEACIDQAPLSIVLGFPPDTV